MALSQRFTFDDLKQILVTRIGISESKIVDDPTLSFDDLGLDSLAFVELQIVMQQQYGFDIPDEDAHKISTIGQAIEYTNRRLAEKN